MKSQTIAQVMKKAKVGDKLTNGKRTWYVKYNSVAGGLVAEAIKGDHELNPKGFELWSIGGIEKVAIIPGLRVIKKHSKEYKTSAKNDLDRYYGNK